MQTVRRSQHKLTFLCAAAMDESSLVPTRIRRSYNKNNNTGRRTTSAKRQQENHSQSISLKMGASLRLRHYLRWGWHCQKWATWWGVCLLAVRVYLYVGVCTSVCVCVGAVRSHSHFFITFHFISVSELPRLFICHSAAPLPFAWLGRQIILIGFPPSAQPLSPPINWKWWRNDFIYTSLTHTHKQTRVFIYTFLALFVLLIIKVDLVVPYSFPISVWVKSICLTICINVWVCFCVGVCVLGLKINPQTVWFI